LRILFAVNYYSPYLSGVSEYARLVAERLAGSGHAVTVLTGRHDAGLPSEEVRNGVRICRADHLISLHKGYLSAAYIDWYWRLVPGADVVNLCLPMLEAGLLAMATPSRTAVAVTYNCDVVVQNRKNPIDWMAVAVVRASARLSFRRANRIFVSSLDYAEGSGVLRGFEGKWIALPPPDKTPPIPARRACGRQRVGFLGRFVAEKGIHVLLDAIPLVLIHVPEAHFVLAGNFSSVAGGSEYVRLRDRLELLQDNVETPGEIPAESLFDFYRSLDVFVLPSIDSYEAFGLVQVEAMKSGVPVIATDRRGVRVPVQVTGNGLLVPPGDAVALAEALVLVLSGRIQFHPEAVARKAWEAFSADSNVAQTIATFEQMIREQRDRGCA